MQSLASLNILHLRNEAVFNKRYFADNGRVYIGTKDGKLRLEDSASETSFSPTSTIQENNVQDAIENLSSSLNIAGAVTSIATAGLISGGVITSTGTITTLVNNNVLVGRYTAGPGVMEQITIGSGLTLTGAGVLNNTATPTPLGYYGAFSDVTDQFATVINTGYPMLLGVTDLTNGVTVVGGSRITIANTGIYNIQWSAQFTNPTSADHDVTIWLRKNGVDVPGSSGIVVVPSKHGSFDGHVLPSWNFLIDVIAGDYYEFVWSTANTSVYISFHPAGTPPPSTASVVLTVTQQSGIMAGTGITAINSLTGSVQTLSTGASGTDFAIVSTGTSHSFNLPTASSLNRGALSAADWSAFNNKQNTLSLTTTGTSGAATLIGSILNIPQYSGGGGGGTRNETTFTATAGQTTFTVNYTINQVDVYYNGSKLAPVEFTATSGTSITLATPCQVGDIIDVIAYIAVVSVSAITFNSQSGTVTATATDGIIVYEFTASGSLILPNAVSNIAIFMVKNRHSSNITVTFTGGQNADGSTSIILVPYQSLQFISNNTNYNIY